MSSQELLSEIQQRIVAATKLADFGEVQRLSLLAQRAARLVQEGEEIRKGLESRGDGRIASEEHHPTSPKTEKGPDRAQNECEEIRRRPISTGDFVIELRWPKTSKSTQEDVCVADVKASRCLTRFMSHLYGVLGDDGMRSAHEVVTSRGPLVTMTPKSDYANQRTKEIYTHHTVANSRWHVITHSSTAEKIRHVAALCRALGLPPGALRAREAEKNERSMTLNKIERALKGEDDDRI